MIVVIEHGPADDDLYPMVFLTKAYYLNKRHPYAAMYHTGELPPHHPVPSPFCYSLISSKVDPRACEMNITDMLLSLLKPRGD